MNTQNPARSRRGTARIVLLALLSTGNALALWLLIMEWQRLKDHGVDADDPEAIAVTGAVVFVVIGLIALAGAWARRPWGPWLYLAISVLSLLFLLVAAPRAVDLRTLVSIALAGLLCRLSPAEK